MSARQASPVTAMSAAARPARPGTRPVAARHAFDTAALERWLAGELAGFSGPLEVAQFAGGQSNPTFLVSTPAAEYVLRKKPPGELLATAHAIDREYRVLQALAASGVPVPTLRGWCEDAGVIGTPFYLMDYQAGRIFTDPLLPTFTPAERGAAYRDMGTTLARLHALDWRALGLADYGRPERFIERQLARWSRQYEASRSDDVPAMERLGAWLAEHMPADDHAAITHGDYRIGNLIYAEDAPRIVAVLDWELCTIGDPVADFFWSLMYWAEPEDEICFLPDPPTRLPQFPRRAEVVACYEEMSEQALPHAAFYMAFGWWKMACIVEGVYARLVKGASGGMKTVPPERVARMVERYLERAAAALD